MTTLPENEAAVTIVSPEDISVQVGGSATFKASITVVADTYTATNYQWQSRTSGGSWEDVSKATGSKLTLTDVAKEDDGTEYRCVFLISYTNLNAAIRYYSDAATLSVGAIGVNVDLTVSGHDGTGAGTLDDPYVGTATTNAQTGTTETTVSSTVPVTIAADSEADTPELTVYSLTTESGEGESKTETTSYYGVGTDADGETVYYAVTKSTDEEGNDSYTAGSPIEVTETVTYYDENGAKAELSFTLNQITYIATNADESTTTYYLMADVNGTTKTAIATDEEETRLASISGITYYWVSGGKCYAYAGAEEVGAAVSGVDADDLYDVLYQDDGNLVLGRTEKWGVQIEVTDDEGNTTIAYDTETGYVYTQVSTSGSGDNTTYTVNSVLTAEVAVSYSDTTFDPGSLEAVTQTIKETVETAVYEAQDGTALTLTADVAAQGDGTAAKNATVDFQIVNIDTGSTETVTAVTESDGTATATWTASASGLYSIQAVVRADATYAKATSEKEYYQADAIYAMETETTEYRLVLQSGSTTLDGTATYGDTVSLVLQSRTVTVETGADGKLTTTRGSWENVSGSVTYEASLSGSEDNTAIAGSSYTPNTVGSYTMYAYLTVTEGETTTKTQVAAASLTVKQRSVTIMPTWDEGTVPSGTNDVTVTADSLASQDSDLELKTIFGISCSYFDLEDKTAASGSYIVSLYYMTYGDTTDAADVETTEETEEEEESGLTPEEEELAAAVKAFKKNYQVTMESDSFYIQKGSARVNFSADENGTLTGQYSDMKFKMATGSRQTTGTALYFTAAPDTGYAVSTWTINGTSYATSDELPAGFEFALDGKQLVVESFDAVEHVGEDGTLTVSVQFASVSNTITYSVDQNGGGSLAAVNGSGQSLSTGASVTNGASVTFTATPDEGYIVDSWSVNGEKWLWDGTEETYAGTTLTLKEIEEDQTVIVSFRESEDTYEVSTKVVDEDEKTDASLATVSAVDAETGETVELSEEVTEGTSLTFTAALTEENNHTVKCWQVSTDGGKSYTTITGSGGQTSVTVYNIAADTQVRVVVTVAQTYVLKYSVVYDDETVDNEELASLTAASNGQKLESGSAVSAYIPVDFTLDLDEDYYVIEWQSKGVSITEDSEDPLKASLESLTEATTVTVVIGKKPVITIEMSEYGSVSVKNGDAAIENGDSVEPGTDLTVTLTPATGYVVDTESLPEGWTYTDTDGTTTDEVTYTIEDVTKDQTVKAAFKELETVQVTYSIVVTTGGQDNGSVTASAARKGLDDYEVDPLESGKTVYAGSTVTFTAAPDEGYRVQEWKVNGEVYKTDAGITYIGETLTLSDLAQATTVTVQFVQKGDEVTVAAGDNGSITSAMVGSNDVTGNIDTGFTLSTDASVTVTAAGDPGYEPDTWLVDGAVVQNGGTTYTYTATGTTAGAAIQVTFRQQEYPVSWTATGGSVTAVDEEEAEYTGSSASIRGGIVVTFTATADDGSVLDYWTVNGEKTEAAEDGSLQWTVPNGAAATPAVTAYEIEAVFKNAPYEILFAQPENGTLSAVDAAGEELLSGGEAENNTDVTFTVTPKDGFLVESWTVNGTPVESQEPTLKMTVTGKTEVSVTLVPDSYTVSYAAEGKGTVAAGEGASVSSGEVSVAYDGSVTFTATPKNSYYMVKGWKIDGEEVTEGVSADKTTLTLSHVKAKATVTAVFTSALGFTVAYSVVGNTGGSLSALVDDEIILTLDEGQSTTVAADSKLEFTAAPEEGMMVSAWTLNGAPVEGNLSTSLVIDKLLEKVTVTVAYEELMTYQVPSTNTGYTVTVTKKVPSDTPGEGDQEIRKNGTVTFIVALADGYNLLTALTVNDTYIWDCLKDEALETEESGETEDPEAAAENVITVQPNEDGSYTITVSNVTQDITLGVTAHKLTHVEAKAATCEENGNIEYWYCSDCEKYFTDAQAQNEITEEETILPKEKVEHSYTAKFTWEGTGSATVSATCDVCGDEVKDLAADITSETSGSSITFTATATYTDEETGLKYTFTDTRTLTEVARKEATCAAAGNIAYWVEETTKTYYSDSTATEELKEVVIAKLTADTDHSWGSPVFTWTGVTTAKVTLTCSVCGKTKTLDATVTRTLSSDGSTATFKAQVTSNEKTYTDSRTLTKVAAKAATCAAAGNIEYWKDTASGTCYSDSTGAKAVSASSVTLAKKTADTDHSWGNPTWSWSGTKSATLTLTCSVCGATKSVKGTVTCTEGTDYNTYKAVAEYNGKNYTDKKKVEVDKVWEDVVFILKGTATKTKNTLKWNKIPGADGYVIYGAKCGSDTYKKLKTITSSKTTSWTRKSLKANSAYKYYVKAYRLVNGKKKFIKKSNLIHLSTKGGKYTNVSKVKITNVTDSKLTLKVGKTKTLKVKTTLAETKKVLRKHMDVLTYSTTDKTIATVSSKGKIKAKKKGTCYIYVQAASGYYAKVKVTVK
ncbi:MAG: Ig-like domain-containing protein [Lachnospiraceae bacterium]|nr:Ig-like domain-containing protein [Lachnospiraceae bacterium]